MNVGKRLLCMLFVLTVMSQLVCGESSHESVAKAAAYTATDVKEAAQALEWYGEKAGDDIVSFLKDEFGYSKPVIKEALQTLIVKNGGYKKFVLSYEERTGINITKSLKKVLGNLTSKGGNLSKMTVLSIEDQLYTGKTIKPTIHVMDGGYQLVKSKDYKLSFTNNKKVGKATVTVTGIGKYRGKLKKSFAIVAVKESDIPTVSFHTADLVGKRTFLTWRVSAGMEYTGIQVLRSDTYDGTYKVIKTIDGKNANAGFIDELDKSKPYYYGVRAYIEIDGKKWTGAMKTMESNQSECNWFSNSDGYVRAWKDSNDSIGFIEYDQNLDIVWNCDWPNVFEQTQMSYTSKQSSAEETLSVNYVLSTPNEYMENGQIVSVGVYYSEKEFYYVWKQDDGGFSVSYLAIDK